MDGPQLIIGDRGRLRPLTRYLMLAQLSIEFFGLLRPIAYHSLISATIRVTSHRLKRRRMSRKTVWCQQPSRPSCFLNLVVGWSALPQLLFPPYSCWLTTRPSPSFSVESSDSRSLRLNRSNRRKRRTKYGSRHLVLEHSGRIQPKARRHPQGQDFALGRTPDSRKGSTATIRPEWKSELRGDPAIEPENQVFSTPPERFYAPVLQRYGEIAGISDAALKHLGHRDANLGNSSARQVALQPAPQGLDFRQFRQLFPSFQRGVCSADLGNTGGVQEVRQLGQRFAFPGGVKPPALVGHLCFAHRRGWRGKIAPRPPILGETEGKAWGGFVLAICVKTPPAWRGSPLLPEWEGMSSREPVCLVVFECVGEGFEDAADMAVQGGGRHGRASFH